ncbi:hypothetical protein ACET3Z_024755 [Daucus carota]
MLTMLRRNTDSPVKSDTIVFVLNLMGIGQVSLLRFYDAYNASEKHGFTSEIRYYSFCAESDGHRASITVKILRKQRLKQCLQIFDWELGGEESKKIAEIPQSRANLCKVFIFETGLVKSLEEHTKAVYKF